MKVIAGQSLFDIAIQENGSVLSALDWAIANNISITEELTPGMELTPPNSTAYHDAEVVNYFNGRKIATSITPENTAVIIPADGIGAMLIDETFEVF